MVAMIYFQVMMMLMLLNMMIVVKVLYYDDDHEENNDNVDDEVMMTMMMVNVLDDPNEVERLHSTPVQVRKIPCDDDDDNGWVKKIQKYKRGPGAKIVFFCEFYKM